MDNEFKEKCPRCESINWELSDKHNNCLCKECRGYFGKEDVEKYWKEKQRQLTPHEQYAELGGTRKPKVKMDKTEQFPYRCPICRTKYFNRVDVIRCIDVCWKKVKEIRKNK